MGTFGAMNKETANRSIRRPGTLRWSTRMILYVVCLGVWFSGGCWLLLHNFFLKQGEFGPETSPLEPWSLKIHGAFAFLAVWIFGLMWGIHISKLWPLSLRRWSGAATGGVFAFLILSGYLLYYVGNDSARSIVSVLHWVIGLASPLVFFWHRLSSLVRKTSHRASRNIVENEAKPVAEEFSNSR